jgi:radical SAM protein with 4Fe4S-binding SPASM domain
MDVDLFQKILDEWKREGIGPYFLLCGIGEPFLHPKFSEIASRCKGIAWSISSNCHLLENHVDDIIQNQPKEIILSIDAATAETHSKIRCGLDFEKVKTGVTKLLTELQKVSPFWDKIYIQFIISHQNRHEVDKFIEQWKPFAMTMPRTVIFLKFHCAWPDSRANTFYDTEFAPVTHGSSSWLQVSPEVNRKIKFFDICKMPEEFFVCHSDGSVSPCCLCADDKFKIGNLKNNTIMELFNGPQMQHYRSLRSRGLGRTIPWCSTCV